MKETIEIIVEKGCGLDIHKEIVAACTMGKGIKKRTGHTAQ
ncbi:MAG: hypothetical protein ACE5EA_08690 [Nitrospirota bacterium]